MALDLASIDWEAQSKKADRLFKELFPLCRSLTGDGVRQTLAALAKLAPFKIKEVASGTACYDWQVPPEWNIREAWVMDQAGRKVIDFAASNLHLASYSIPVDAELSFEELDPHLHTLPAMPGAIPYRTLYYKRDWAFCLTHDDYQKLDRAGRYRVHVDSSLNDQGSLSYAELILPGKSGGEYLISTYMCHPSLANDNLSGPILTALLAGILAEAGLEHGYRIIMVPETIGAICYLKQNQEAMKNLAGGFVATTVAGPGPFGYKQTFQEGHLIDRVVDLTFRELGLDYIKYPFDVMGSDESHYSAPYFRIPVGTICKDKYYEYPYYHTSLDNLDFVGPDHLVACLQLYLSAIEKLEMNRVYQSQMPYCEPMLGKRGLYPQTGGMVKQPASGYKESGHLGGKYPLEQGQTTGGDELDAIGWVMFESDGQTSLLDIAEKTGLSMRLLFDTAQKLASHGLLKES